MTLLSTNFLLPSMFLLLLCLGTILAPTCPASCQLSYSLPPRLGPSGRPGSTPSAVLLRPLCSPALWPPLLHHQSRVAGRSGRRLKACTAADATPGSLHCRDRQGTRPINGHRPRGWTSDLFSSQPRPELMGSPVESCLRPWRCSHQSGVLYPPCTVSVYKPAVTC
jgi:hypothetical protein